MASEVEICNLALNKFGDLSITALTDASKEARACKVFYPIMRDLMLFSHPWNFAMKRADISAQVTTAPAFGFDYAYTLPADCHRVWELYGSTVEWVVESGQLLTDQEEEIYIRYIRKVTESGYFSPAFVDCLGTRLASELALKLGKDAKMAAYLLDRLDKIDLPQARMLNAMEGNRPKTDGEKELADGSYSWVTEGR